MNVVRDDNPTRLDMILPVILARLQFVTGLKPEACFLSQSRRMPYDGIADQYLWVRVDDNADDADILQGAGRIDARETQTIAVTVRTRLELDPPARDIQWLTQASLGHLLLVHKVKDALVTFFPMSGSTLLTVAPLVPVRGGSPQKDEKLKEWGESVLNFSFIYQLDLDTTYQ